MLANNEIELERKVTHRPSPLQIGRTHPDECSPTVAQRPNISVQPQICNMFAIVYFAIVYFGVGGF